MTSDDKVNILLVDDQPSKLLTYEVILRELGDNLIKASSGKEALEQLLRNEIAVVLMDVCMPELDGFELASMIREHPRFQKIAMIFISAIHLAEIDHLRGYEMGAVDYVPVPVVPEVLRAKVRVFADLYRKNRQLERLNAELEAARRRAHRRAGGLDHAAARKRAAAQPRARRRQHGLVGLGPGRPAGSSGTTGQHAIYGVKPGEFIDHAGAFKVLIVPEDWERLQVGMQALHDRRASASGGVPRAAAQRRDALVRQHRRGDATTTPARSCGSAASRWTSPTARKPRSARRCSRARSIIAPRTRWRSFSRSCG